MDAAVNNKKQAHLLNCQNSEDNHIILTFEPGKCDPHETNHARAMMHWGVSAGHWAL